MPFKYIKTFTIIEDDVVIDDYNKLAFYYIRLYDRYEHERDALQKEMSEWMVDRLESGELEKVYIFFRLLSFALRQPFLTMISKGMGGEDACLSFLQQHYIEFIDKPYPYDERVAVFLHTSWHVS